MGADTEQRRPRVGDFVRHRQLKLRAEVINWIGPHLIEVKFLDVPTQLRGEYPPGSLKDTPWDWWEIIGRRAAPVVPICDSEADTDEFEPS